MTQRRTTYQPGDRIGGRYLVHRALAGGMGEVYLCLDEQDRIPIALKTFQRRSDKLREAFYAEVGNWVALEQHANIVRCFYMDTFANRPFAFLEWVAGDQRRGTSLREWLRRGPLEARQALDFTIDVCRGLRHAQTKVPGMVHRDLKPDNVLVSRSGVAKIIDFGLATVAQVAGLGPENDTPQLSGLGGTPLYMAPEQWRGEELDQRADIYAVGCMLYELLTGQFVYWASHVSQLKDLHFGAPIPPLPGHDYLQPVLEQCLAKDPADRYADAEALLAALEPIYAQRFDTAPRPAPDDQAFAADDYSNRGLTYNALSRYEEALNDLSRAIELEPDYAGDYNNRGIAYHGLGRLQEALDDFSHAIELDPDFAGAFTNRGNVYRALQHYADSLGDHQRAIELDPTFAMAYANRGDTYHAMGQHERALADFTYTIELEPTFAHIYSKRGASYRALSQHAAAIDDYTQAIKAQPDDPALYFYRANSHAALGQHERAIADYSRSIQLEPNRAVSYGERANVYKALERHAEALEDYNRAIELEPTAVEHYYNRGNTYATMKQFEQAVADWERCIALNPTAAPPYASLGLMHYQHGRLEEALRYFDQAAALGFEIAAQHAAQVRQEVEAHNASPPLQAFALLRQAASPAEMQAAVARFAFMTDPAFIHDVEQIVQEQIPPEHRPHFEQRLAWLKQIAAGE